MIGFKDTKLKFVRKRSRNGNLIQDVATPTSPGTNLNPTQISSLDDDNDEATKFIELSKDSSEKPALLDELEEEIERQLESKARKNNLSVSNVKNMIKTDDESKIDDSFIEEELLGKEAINNIKTENLESNLHFDGSIGQRTRSKLCLSETPLEAIEQAFVPPDITTDMYATSCENPDWVDFLKEFTQPFNACEQNECNDDDNDPEYNVMVDEEIEGTDREELRMDRAVKVSKKELNALISECFEYNAIPSDDEENANMESMIATTGIKQEEESDCYIVENLNDCDPLRADSDVLSWNDINLVNDNKLKLSNIKASMDLASMWEAIFEDPDKKATIQRSTKKYERKKRLYYKPEIPMELIRICRESRAFMYPLMLPSSGFRPVKVGKSGLLPSEINLIAFGLHEYMTENDELMDLTKDIAKIVDHVTTYKVPAWSKPSIKHFIQRSFRMVNTSNSVKSFIETNTLPKINHYVIPMPDRMLKLYEQSPVLLPEKWRLYLRNLSK
uniref:Uncharacterized protein n=1 Tax=Rhodnius prolixus TaxID=13249 RepID=T1HBD0_RHOPR